MRTSCFGPFPGQGAGQGAGQGFVDADVGGGVNKSRGGVSTDTAPLPAGFVRAFGAKPDSPRRASGEGLDGSDPPFLTAGAVSRGGGVDTGVYTGVNNPPNLSVGVAPVVCILAGRLRGRRPRRPISLGKHAEAASMRATALIPPPFLKVGGISAVARVDVASACFPRPIPWPCSSATTRRTCTPPSSPGTTSRRAWPCSSSANSSSARRGSGSPGWASVWGSGPGSPRGRFRLRRTARRLSSGRSITRSKPSRARAPNG